MKWILIITFTYWPGIGQTAHFEHMKTELATEADCQWLLSEISKDFKGTFGHGRCYGVTK